VIGLIDLLPRGTQKFFVGYYVDFFDQGLFPPLLPNYEGSANSDAFFDDVFVMNMRDPSSLLTAYPPTCCIHHCRTTLWKDFQRALDMLGGTIYMVSPGSGTQEYQYVHTVRGRSTSSDVSSDISPSPLYIPPPHRRQPKTECTRGSDTGV